MLPLITSVHNPRIKAAARLRDRKGREAQGRIIIDGLRELGHALQSDIEFLEVYIDEGVLQQSPLPAMLDTFEDRGVPVFPVASHVYAKLRYGERDDGIVAVAKSPQRRLSDLRFAGIPFVAVLAGVQKPGNVGAILRSADAAGVSAVIVADGGTDLFNPNAIRASMGTIFRLPICAATGESTRRWLHDKGFKAYAARVGASRWYCDVPWQGPSALVLGSEAHGLSEGWSDSDFEAISLPMRGIADSLNVSATAAVIFYEVWRQRR